MAAPFAYLLVFGPIRLSAGRETPPGSFPAARLPAHWADLLYGSAGRPSKEQFMGCFSALVVDGALRSGRNVADLESGFFNPRAGGDADPFHRERWYSLCCHGRSILFNSTRFGIQSPCKNAFFKAMAPFPSAHLHWPAHPADFFKSKL